jgi:hypothetical protein
MARQIPSPNPDQTLPQDSSKAKLADLTREKFYALLAEFERLEHLRSPSYSPIPNAAPFPHAAAPPQKSHENDSKDIKLLGNRQCEICWETKLQPEFPHTTITATCNHPADICLLCLEQVILAELVAHPEQARVRCHSLPCAGILGVQDIRRWGGTSQTIELYCDRRFNEIMSQNPAWQTCKVGSCKAGRIFGTREEGWPSMKCRECGAFTCARHGVEWHEGFTCEEHDEVVEIERLRKKDEEWVERLKWREAKNCPNCGRAMVKDFGVDRVTCTGM